MRTENKEEQINTGLRGNTENQTEAICKAHDAFAPSLAAFVRESFPFLDSHEIVTIVNDAFIELAKKANRGEFKPCGSLKALLFKMVRWKAIDLVRKHLRRTSSEVLLCDSGSGPLDDPADELSDDDVASLVASKLANASDIATAWRIATQEWTPGKQAEVFEIVRQFKIWMGTLPQMQRKVAKVMVKHYGNVTDEEICDEIAMTDKPPSLGSVKSARREIREKFASLLEQKERIKTI